MLTRNINENINKISDLREELTKMKADYAEMVRKSYKSKNQQNRVMFLLSSENFLQAYKRVQYMKQYANFRKKQGEGIKEKTEQLQKLNADLIEQKKDKQKLISENEASKKALTKERKDQRDLVATLKKDEGKYTSQIRNKQREADEIDRQIEALIKAAIEEANRLAREKALAESKAAGTTVSTKNVITKPAKTEAFALTAEDKALATSFASNKGKLPWPVEKGMVIKSFGRHQHPQFPNVTTNNSGVEIATNDNAEVRTIFDGQVMAIQLIKGANKVVFIQHGDFISVYSNLATVNVKKGDKVLTKQTIGTVAKSPTEGRTVLKFYIYQNKTKINPADWIYRM